MTPDTRTPWDTYPHLFATTAQGGCGHGCGAGWYPLINEACAQFAEIAHATGVQPLVYQSKEKYGGLRLYTQVTCPEAMSQESSDAWYLIVQCIAGDAESRSTQTCEESGQWGKPRPLLGWIKTLSDLEYAKRVKERYGQTVEEFEAARTKDGHE